MKGHAREIMSTSVSQATPETTLVEIARLLCSASQGGLPVVDAEGAVVGFVSATDVVTALLQSRAPETTAKELMTSPAATIDEFATSDDVMKLLRERHIHHLPVVRSGRLVGMISPEDILGFFVKRVAPSAPEAG